MVILLLNGILWVCAYKVLNACLGYHNNKLVGAKLINMA
jgi:hypothetical protein